MDSTILNLSRLFLQDKETLIPKAPKVHLQQNRENMQHLMILQNLAKVFQTACLIKTRKVCLMQLDLG